MRRAFLIGAAVGFIVFVQAMIVFRVLPARVRLLELWALAWSGLFGLTVSSTFVSASQAMQSLTVAGVAVVLFYGFGAMLLRAAHRTFKRVGVGVALIALLCVHVGLYLWVIRSVVA